MDLLKVKDFEDAEFPIIAIEEGRGKLAGHAGKFVCLLPSGQTFKPKAKGPLKNLKEYWEDHSTWKGRSLMVRFQGYTQYGIPRIPTGIRFRDSVDF